MNVAAPRRKVTRVAVGVLLRDDGRVLLADRPTGKPYAGYWEFPGGKIEAEEPVARALERELHEELGIEIGPSKPWVTFEFDYPHAYVELQFRLVRRWRGRPSAREGQRLRFVDPAGELPRPLLPAAVPALRWLLLPRTVIVLTPRQAATEGSATAADGATCDGEGLIIVVDGGGFEENMTAPARVLQSSAGKRWLMTAGARRRSVAGWDGAVLDPCALDAGQDVGGWRGAWVDSDQDLRLASSRGCDFVLARSEAAVAALCGRPAALPVYLPAGRPTEAKETCCHGRWIDLRSCPPANSTSLSR